MCTGNVTLITSSLVHSQKQFKTLNTINFDETVAGRGGVGWTYNDLYYHSKRPLRF